MDGGTFGRIRWSIGRAINRWDSRWSSMVEATRWPASQLRNKRRCVVDHRRTLAKDRHVLIRYAGMRASNAPAISTETPMLPMFSLGISGHTAFRQVSDICLMKVCGCCPPSISKACSSATWPVHGTQCVMADLTFDARTFVNNSCTPLGFGPLTTIIEMPASRSCPSCHVPYPISERALQDYPMA